MKAGGSRRRDQRGAVLVEAVFVIPLLMLLTFGAIEFGLGFSQKGGLESVSRSGARKAATLSGLPDSPTDHEIGIETADAVNAALETTSLPSDMNNLYVYKVTAGGVKSGNKNGCIDANSCMSFHYDKTATPPRFVYDSGRWPVDDRDSCSDTPDRVGVTVVGTFKFLIDFGGWGDIPLAPTSILQLEPTTCNG